MNAVAGGRRRWPRAVIAGVSLLILFAPLTALVLGQRGRPLENRPLAPFPAWDSGWSGFGQAARFFGDRIPLRTQAIRSDSWIDRKVFGEDIAFGGASLPQVIRGDDGYLFLAEDFANACSPTGTVEEAVANMHKLGDLIRGTGRQAVFMVAPNKSTVLRSEVPSDLAQKQCWEDFSQSLWQALGTTTTKSFIDLKAGLEGPDFHGESPLYLRTDSHWNSAGSLVAVKAAVDAFQPGVWNDSDVAFDGETDYRGDLGLLDGTKESETARVFEVRRRGVTEVSRVPVDDSFTNRNLRIRNSGPEGTLVRGRTLMIADSFGEVTLERLVPFFEDLTFVHFSDWDDQKFAALMREADNIWVMTAERYFTWRFTLIIGSPEFQSLLRSDPQMMEP